MGRKESCSCYIGPFEILERIGKVVYRLTLPQKLSIIHDVFYMSMIKKYVSDSTHVLAQEAVQVSQDLSYKEKHVQILDKKEKELRNKKISLVKVL